MAPKVAPATFLEENVSIKAIVGLPEINQQAVDGMSNEVKLDSINKLRAAKAAFSVRMQANYNKIKEKDRNDKIQITHTENEINLNTTNHCLSG